MFKIYRLIRDLSRDANTKDFEGIVDFVTAEIRKYGDDYRYYQSGNVKRRRAAGASRNPFPQIDDSTYGVEKLTLHEILDLLGEATDVVKYCNVDAGRCHEIINIRNMIPDHREMANLSYTSMDDAVYKADGMKVRNLVITRGIEPEWNIAFTNISNGIKDDRKYPGAYVVPPKKGLYRDHAMVKEKRVEIKNMTRERYEEVAAEIAAERYGTSISGQPIRYMKEGWSNPQSPDFDTSLRKSYGVVRTIDQLQEDISGMAARTDRTDRTDRTERKERTPREERKERTPRENRTDRKERTPAKKTLHTLPENIIGPKDSK
jgi:hypothetical protein